MISNFTYKNIIILPDGNRMDDDEALVTMLNRYWERLFYRNLNEDHAKSIYKPFMERCNKISTKFQNETGIILKWNDGPEYNVVRFMVQDLDKLLAWKMSIREEDLELAGDDD